MSDYFESDFPKRVEIELSNVCNLKCSYCPRRYIDNKGGFMDKMLFKKIIDEVSVYPETVIVLHRRGESMLHPAFNELLDYVAGKFKEVQLATNATLLEENMFTPIVKALSFISFSLAPELTFNVDRKPAKFKEVEAKILKFLSFNKGRVRTQASMVKTPKTPADQIKTFEYVWKNRVDRVRVYEEHSIDGIFGSIRNPRNSRMTCVMPFYELLIYDNGLVGRCNHDWNGEPMGDIRKNSIFKIWHSDRYKQLRLEQKSLNFKDPVCLSCDSWYPQIGNQGTGKVVDNE